MEVQILKNYSTLSRKFTKYYSMLMYTMMVIFISIPLKSPLLDIVIPLNESRPRFFAVVVEFRVDKNEYFLPIFCYITAVIVVGTNVTMSVDAMHIACTAHACSLFAAVSKQIENIIPKTDSRSKINKREYDMDLDPSSEKMIYEEYITCLKKHQLAIEFVDVLDSSYQGISLVMLILVIGTMSLIGIRIVHVLDQLSELTRSMFIMMGSLVTLIIICYSSQRLLDESQSIFHRAYAAEWYNFSPRLKTLLIITLCRTSIPCGLKAGNMIPLSIATYAAVLRTAMSYFTAFLSLQD